MMVVHELHACTVDRAVVLSLGWIARMPGQPLNLPHALCPVLLFLFASLFLST
jgi:hypothetical protein